MQVEKKLKAKPRKKTGLRILKWLLVLIVAVILLIVLAVPAFVSSENGREIILAKINSSIDGRTDLAGLSMSWWTGIKVTDLSFNDSAGKTSIEVKKIATKPHYCSILMGNLSFGKTVIDEPKVNINRVHHATESSPQSQPAAKKAQPVILPIKNIDLVVNDGSLKVTDLKAQTVELSQINSKLNLRPPGQQTDFDINMAVVDEGKESKIHAVGQIKPKRRTGWSLKGTTGNLTIEVNDLDLGSLESIFALAGVEVQAKGRLSANLTGGIKNGQIENLNANINGRDLDITAGQLKGDRLKSSLLDANVKLARRQKMINVENFDIKADWLKAQASGTVPTTFDSFAEFLKSDSSLAGSFELDIAKVFAQMPKTFGVKENMQVISGRLTGKIETSTQKDQRQVHGQASLAGLAGMVEGRKVTLSQPVNATAKITSDKTGINVDSLDVSAPFARINCSGSTELLNHNVDVNLAELQAQLGPFIDMGGYQLAGQMFEKGTISAKDDKVTAVGSSTIKNLRIISKEGVTASEPQADIDFTVDYNRKDNIATIDSIKTHAGFGRFDIKDAILPIGEKAKKPLQMVVSASSVDLSKLQPFAVMFAAFPKETKLAGTAESQLSISSKDQICTIKTDSTNIKNLKILSPGKQPFVQGQVQLVFDGDLNLAEKDWTVRKLQLLSPDIKIKFDFEKDVQGDKTKVQGNAQLEYDWSAIGNFASIFLPAGLTMEGKRKDTLTFSSEYPTAQPDKFVANLNTKGKLGFEKAEYMGLNFGLTDVDVQIQNGLLKIAPFSTTVNNGQFNFAGQMDFKQKPTLLKTPAPMHIIKDIQINDQTSKKLLTYLNPIFANAVNVNGVANLNCERLAIPLAGAAKNDIEVIGTVSVSKLRLQASDLLGQILSVVGTGTPGTDITIRPTRFVLQDGFLRYDDMQIDVGDNPVNFKGTIGLDKSLNMTVTLPYTTSGRTARLGKETVGERVTLPLTGSIDKPQLDMGKLLEDQLKQQLQEQLRRGLEDLLK